MDATSSASILQVSQIFYNFTAGLGTLLAGGAGLVAVNQFFTQYRANINRNQLKKRYSKEKINSEYKLVDFKKEPGKIYLLDLQTNRIHWIASAQTMTDLDFSWNDVIHLDTSEFDKYQESEKIHTSGVIGS